MLAVAAASMKSLDLETKKSFFSSFSAQAMKVAGPLESWTFQILGQERSTSSNTRLQTLGTFLQGPLGYSPPLEFQQSLNFLSRGQLFHCSTVPKNGWWISSPTLPSSLQDFGPRKWINHRQQNLEVTFKNWIHAAEQDQPAFYSGFEVNQKWYNK